MENQRVRLSKSMLKEALISLLQEKSIGKISIYELCQRAGINRSTFYKYYGSQYDLLEDIENDVFSELERLLTLDGDKLENLVPVLEYLEKERRKILVFINTVADSEFADKLFGLPIIHELFYRNIFGPLSDTAKEYVFVFFCHGSYALIVTWLSKENRESPQEISNTIYELGGRLALLG